MIRIIRAGPGTLVQDLGRAGYAHIGVTRSGAWDRESHSLAQRLVGNEEGAAGIEVLLGGLEFVALHTITVAVTGHDCPVTVGGRAVGVGSPVAVRRGEMVVVGRAARGARHYVAVRGGLAVPPALGSRSTDTLAGLGPGQLRPDDVLPTGDMHSTPPVVDHAAVRERPPRPLRLVLGPRHDWFDSESVRRLLDREFTVQPASNRVGIRLAGPALRRSRKGEVAPEAMVRGAVQVPPDGNPVILGPDHPSTGGYPVIACIIDSDTDRCAQLLPGDSVRFTSNEDWLGG